jgi:hypothetical protein
MIELCLRILLAGWRRSGAPRRRHRNHALPIDRYRPLLETLETRLTPSVLVVDQAHANCSDAGSGTSAQPFCTISAAAARAVAGDTVSVASGTYREQVTVKNSGTLWAPVVFEAAEGAVVTVTGGKYGFFLSAKSWVTVRGFRITQTTDDGINVSGSSNITIEANDVSFAGQPVSGLTASGIKVTGSNNSLVSRNITHDNSDAGILITTGATAVTVSGNESFANARGWTRAAPGIDVRSGGNIIIGNRTHHNEDTGIQVRSTTGTTEAANNLILNNITYDNGDHGIDALRAPGQIIVGNVVYNNPTAGINLEGASTGSTIANNISVDNGIDSTRTEGNIRVDADSLSGTTSDYNVLWIRPTPESQYLIIWGATKYTSLAAFVAATGMETHGIQADPLWVAAGAADFHLKPGSPAIDSANSGVSGQTETDADGKPRVDDPGTANTGAGPRPYDDRGPFEFQPVVTPQPASISGAVFEDRDGDAFRDVADQGLSGWTVFLDSNANGILDTGEASRTTDAQGNYTFADLAPGTYRARLVLPSGWVQTVAPGDISLNGSSVAGADFGAFRLFTISGQVFDDQNRNALKDAAEPGLSGWAAFLDADADDTLDAGEVTTTSGVDGQYQFANLGPGSYRVRLVVQSGWSQTTSPPSVIGGASGVDVSNVLFGVAVASGSSSISGLVFEDRDGDALLDAGERGLAGWTVFLDDNANGILELGETSTLSAAGGTYQFSGLGTGTYRVRIAPPSGWTRTTANPADIVLNGSTSASGVNFGGFDLIEISGQVYSDRNGNGVKDPEDTTGASGWTVYLDLNNNGTRNSAEPSVVSDAAGGYRFANIGPGTYRVRMSPRSVGRQTSANPADVVPVSGVDAGGRDFGVFLNATIAGRVFEDLNRDGIRQSKEPWLLGWTVFLDDNGNGILDAGERTDVTDSSGRYKFYNLGIGTYRVRLVLQSGWVRTNPDPGDISPLSGDNIVEVNFAVARAT